MSNLEKIKIVFPDGNRVECDDLLALIRDYDQANKFKKFIIGNWGLDDVIVNKSFLIEIFNEEIRDKLTVKDKIIFDKIITKRIKLEEELIYSLSEEEIDLYKFIFPQGDLMISSRLDQILLDFKDVELEEVVTDIIKELDMFSEETVDSKLNAKDSQNKVINLDQYRKNKSLMNRD